MLINFLFLGLVISVNLSYSSIPSPRHARSPPPSIRSLFTIGPGRNLTYPPLDIAGPEPRREWVEAYQRAVQAGLIPQIPKSKVVDYVAVYPPFHGTICNQGLNNCNITGDVISAPPGMAGISFDDGPSAASLELLEFLKSHSQKATHFMIASRILSNIATFEALDAAGEHLAVHTYSHPMMTSLTDHQILGELGWTMQTIHDYSRHNHIPRHWRPPYGDVDRRVDAIARHVFGLETVLWRYDPRDWCLSDSVPKGSACSIGHGPQNLVELEKELTFFTHNRKQDGLMILEHEQSHRAVDGFKYALPLMRKLNWITKPIPDLFNSKWYQ